MKNKFVILFLSVFLFACNNKEKVVEYYPDNSIHKKYTLKKGIMEGNYVEYFNDNKIKYECIFKNGVKVDFSLLYNQNPYFLNQIDFYKKQDTVYSVSLYDNGIRENEGELFEGRQIGKWTFYKKTGEIDKIIEYVNLNGKQYTNQGWYFNKDGDTIKEFGNYYNYKLSSNEIFAGEVFELEIEYKPLLVVNGDLIAVFHPKVESDYSNIDSISLDTIVFQQNKGFSKVSFKDSGKKNLRGYIQEIFRKNDSVAQRKLYIDIPIIVK